MLTSSIALILTAVLIPSPQQTPNAPADQRQQVATLVASIQRADYEDDRQALARLRDQLTPFLGVQALSSRVQYWRGFALWRRVMNGFNDSVDPKELQDDVVQAIADFTDAMTRDASSADAKAGKASCLAILAVMNFKAQRPESRDQIVESVRLANEAAAAAPENPRVLWVQGANQWGTPPQLGGEGPTVARETYTRALNLARRQRARVGDSLEPAWGEPELLMTLAYISLNGAVPDAAAAERYAQEALTLVPTWHYLRDILMPQIRNARKPQ